MLKHSNVAFRHLGGITIGVRRLTTYIASTIRLSKNRQIQPYDSDPNLLLRHTGQVGAQIPLSLRFERSLVGLGRFELPASSLSGMRSNQLSYKPITHVNYQALLARMFERSLVEMIGLEPTTSALQRRRSPN